MEIPLYDDLLNDNEIRKIDLAGEYYFHVGDIRKKYDDVKFDTNKMIDFNEEKYIQHPDIHLMTDFDKKIQKSLRFNPKK